MAKHVTENRMKSYTSLMIFFLVMTIIPVIIVMLTGFKSFTTVYGIYSLVALGTAVFFSVVMALFAWRNKVVYIILDLLSLIGGIAFLVLSYVFSSYQGGLLLHLATTFYLTYAVFRLGDAKLGDNYIFRFFLPFIYLIIGLIFVLWLINVHMRVDLHILFSTITNVIATLFFLIPSFVKSLKKGEDFFLDLQEETLEYTSTEDEFDAKIAAKKEAKAIEKAVWMAEKNEVIDVTNMFLKKINEVISDVNFEINKCVDDYNRGYNMETNSKSIDALKEINKALHREGRKIKSNLKWLLKAKFKGKDQYKVFNYNASRGSISKKNREYREPVLFVMGLSWSITRQSNDNGIYYYYNFRFDTDPVEITINRVE